jgi:hypothetical protein
MLNQVLDYLLKTNTIMLIYFKLSAIRAGSH